MEELVVQRLFVQLLTSEFGSLQCNKAAGPHVGGERRRRSHIYCSAAAGAVSAAVLATLVFFDTTCSRVSCNRC